MKPSDSPQTGYPDHPAHKCLLEVIKCLEARGVEPTPVAIREEVERAGK